MLYLAYGLETREPAQATVGALTSPATLTWHPNALVTIEAQTEADAFSALGYVHGTRHPWHVVLWRQTAAGHLAEWFRDGVLPLDRLTRRLGLAELARTTYYQLPDD